MLDLAAIEPLPLRSVHRVINLEKAGQRNELEGIGLNAVDKQDWRPRSAQGEDVLCGIPLRARRLSGPKSPGQRSQGRCLHQVTERKRDAPAHLSPRNHLHRPERVPTQVEEAVCSAHGLDAKHVGPDLRQPDLFWRLGRLPFRPLFMDYSLRLKRASIHLAIG